MERQEALHGYGANGSDRQPEHNGNVSEPSPECAGMYYFDPHLNQPVSTASWSGSTQPCDVRDGARWQGSESYPKGEPKRPGSQDRSRRKGEPSRYDRRVWSRSRTGAADQHHRYEERLWRDSRNQAGANHYEQSPRYDSCEPNITPSKTSVGHSKHQLPYKQWRSKVHGSVGAEQYGETWSDVPCDAATDHSWQHSQHDPRGGQDASNTVSLGKPEYTPPSRQKRNGIGPPKVPQASSRGATSRPKGRSTNRRTNQDRKQKPGDNSSRLDGNLLEPGGPCLLETLFGIKQEHCSPPSESPSNSYRPVACQNEPSSSCASTESHSGKPAGTPETGVKQRNWPDRKKRHQAVGDERSHHTDLQREVSCREYRNRRGNESSRCRKEDRLGGFHDVWDGRKKHGPDVWQEGASAGAHAWETECRKQRSTHGKAAAQSVIAEGSSKRQSPTKKGYPQVNRADDAPQKDRLTEQLLLGEYECMVCCERVRGSEPIWSCGSCFHIFHLQCARKWALSPAALVKEGGWRCPACQGTVLSVPSRYMCFCGKRSNPEWNRYGVPHSCGEMCGRLRGSPNAGSIPCVHRCNLQCHPGQCPPCSATVRRACPCGKLTRQVRCSQDHDTSCGRPCERLLNCELHECQELCHAGSCKPCSAIVHQGEIFFSPKT